MREIGGYFGLEIEQKSKHYHPSALRLNTGRNCLEYILKAKNYKKIYLPYYTCDVMLEPLKKINIDYEFYHLTSSLEPILPSIIDVNDAILYTNYFGVKQKTIQQLSRSYDNLIIDNVQAFFAKPIDGIDTFYSARKFFGVPDGAYLYTNKRLDITLPQDISYNRFEHLLKRIDISANFGFDDFKTNDNCLINNPIKTMSNLTESILGSIDYEFVKMKRVLNFKYLDDHLRSQNLLEFNININAENDTPMVYPLFLKDIKDIRSLFLKNKIYIATYWQNVLQWVKSNSLEYKLVNNVLPLPIDHRYSEKDMDKIIEIILR